MPITKRRHLPTRHIENSMSSTKSLSGNTLLLEYANGAATRTTKHVQRLLAPQVLVPVHTGRHSTFGDKLPSLRIPSTLRALGHSAAQIRIDMGDSRYSCDPHSFDIPQDASDEEVLDFLIHDSIDLTAEIASQVTEIEVIDKAVEAAGAGIEADWSNPDVDPVVVIDAEIKSLIPVSLAQEFAVIFGINAWEKFKYNPHVKARGTNALSWETAKNLFHTGARFETSYGVRITGEGAEVERPVFTFPEDAAMVVASSENPNRRDPSFMKTFTVDPKRLGSKLIPSGDGRFMILKMDWSTDIQVTNAHGVRRLNVR